MILEFVDGMSEQLGVALHKVRLMHCNAAQLGGAHGGKVRRMGEQDYPSIYNEEKLIIVV